jgi:hypothetical protein
MQADAVRQLQDRIADELREHLADRNASLPDATGFSAPYSGPGGCYTDIVRGEVPDGLLRRAYD